MSHYGMLPSVETNKLPFRRQEKSTNDGFPNVRCAVSLPHCFNVICVLEINLFPFLQEEALNDNVMRNYMLMNFECFVVLLNYMFDPLVLNDL